MAVQSITFANPGTRNVETTPTLTTTLAAPQVTVSFTGAAVASMAPTIGPDGVHLWWDYSVGRTSIHSRRKSVRIIFQLLLLDLHVRRIERQSDMQRRGPGE